MNDLGRPSFRIDYGESVEQAISEIEQVLSHFPDLTQRYQPRWLAIKLLEGEADIAYRIRGLEGGEQVWDVAQCQADRLIELLPEGLDIVLADRRYSYIGKVIDRVLHKPSKAPETFSDRLDGLVTHPWLGAPLFLIVMYLVFNLVVNISTPYLDWIDSVVAGPVTRWAGAILLAAGAPEWLQGLVLEGVIPGVGGVLVFLPGLGLLFLFIGLLEDTGYMARAAVVMDRFLRFLGLNGKSFVPMILGFGCAVPAIYATRTLDHRRDRILTALLVPLMSCAARLPVFVVFGLAFFAGSADLVVWSLYALGILVAAAAGLLFSKVLFRGKQVSLFVIELPPYRWPNWRNLWRYISTRIADFVQNAGTVILIASVVIWLLLNLPASSQDLRDSWFGQLSERIAPVFKPAGFGTWEATGSLVTGLIAKEVVVSTMSQIYLGDGLEAQAGTGGSLRRDLGEIAVGFSSATITAGKELMEVLTPGISLFQARTQGAEDTSLSASLQTAFTPLSSLAFMVFVLLYVPCVATLGAIRGEFGAKWAWFSALYQLSAAWLVATLVYQVGRLLGYGTA